MDCFRPLQIRPPCKVLILVGLLFCLGCGDDPNNPRSLVPVGGKVTLDGKPLTKAVVTFVPQAGNPIKVNPTGALDETGSYQLVTSGIAGAPRGAFKACVALSPADEDNIRKKGLKLGFTIDPKYRSPDTTPFSIQVENGAQPGAYDLNLTSK